MSPCSRSLRGAPRAPPGYGPRRCHRKPPACEHGEWAFAGADFKRKATKWRCPTGECKPASVWVKADQLHPLIPRETERSRKLYHSRGGRRARVRSLEARVGATPLARPWT